MTRHRSASLIVVALAFAAFFTVFFAPALFGGNFLTDRGDGMEIALPFYTVPHGLWEPDIMLGYPWASNLNGYWDPLFLLHWIPHSFNAYMLAAYVIAAVGAYGLVEALTGSIVGGAVAGVAYALGGFMIGHLGHYDVVHPAAWTPYVLWAFIAQRRRPGVRPIALGAVAIALCAMAGQPQVLAYTLLLVAGYTLTVGLAEPKRLRYVGGALATMGLGICLAAITLAPGALLALSSFRAAPSLDYFLTFSEPVRQLPIRLLLPYVLGQSGQPLYPFSTQPIGSNVELAGYAGIVTLVLAVVAVLARRSDRDVLFFAFAAVAALVLSTGDGLHVAFITFHLPILNLFRAQGRHMLEFTLLAAVLGGIGAAEIARGNVSARRLGGALALVGLALAATVAEALLLGLRTGDANDPLRNPAFFVPVLVFVAACVVLTIVRRRPSSRLAGALLVACAAADLTTFAWFQYWRSPASEAMLQPPPAVMPLRAELERTHQRLFTVTGSASPSVGVPPNTSLVWGVPEAGGLVQLLLTAPGIFLQLFVDGTMTDALLDNGTDRSLDLAAIRYVVIPSERAAALLAARHSWRLVGQGPIGAIIENPHAEARVRIVHRVVSMPPSDALQAIRTGSLDTHTTALVPGAQPLDTPPDPADAADVIDLHDDRMQVRVACRSTCFLVTSDNFSGMWRAAIDGARVPLVLTDYTLRGVFVPAGTHTVSFSYRPWIIELGAATSGVTACIIIGVLVFALRRNGARELRAHERIETNTLDVGAAR